MTSEWLPRALEESRARGFLGPGAITPHIEHALGFALLWEELRNTPPQSFLDLGSGGGLPGLVLVDRWATPRAVLLDAMAKRTRFLEECLTWKDAPQGVSVQTGRAEDLARQADLREQFTLVVCRSFGPPAVTAECAAGFLGVQGLLIVSEPPEAADRWDNQGLALLGLEPVTSVQTVAHYAVFQKVAPLDDRFPRPNGVPGKKPLF